MIDVPQTGVNTRMLHVSNLRYAYPDGLLAVNGMDLELRAGEVLSIIGLSGCGKSTLLSLIAGTKIANGGRIEWNEALVDDTATRPKSGLPTRRRLSLVFQRDTVLPWRTVEENIGFGLDYIDIARAERTERIESLLKMVRMTEFRKAYPKQLSGGMRRRVAVLTGVAPLPHLLLLDEPFGGLDEPTRVSVHSDLLAIVHRLGLSVILVTHDLSEAITLGDRVVVLTRRPARVACVIETNFGRSRDVHTIRETPEYLDLYARTWHELYRQAGEPDRLSAAT